MDNPADRLYISFQLVLGEEGRKKAFARIWRVYGKRIHYYIARILPREITSPDDCYQEVMMKIYEGLGGYGPDRPLKPWIYRVARNCCIDFMKKRGDIRRGGYRIDALPERTWIPANVSFGANYQAPSISASMRSRPKMRSSRT